MTGDGATEAFYPCDVYGFAQLLTESHVLFVIGGLGDEFSAADMTQFIAMINEHDIRIGRVSRVPIHYITGETKAESGRAKRLNEAPFVEKMTDRIRERAPVYAAAVSYGLRLEGTAVDPGELRVNFESPAPMSVEDDWDLAAAKAEAGLPLVSILREAGYNPDQITLILEEKRREMEAGMMDMGTFAGALNGVNRDEPDVEA